MRRLILLWCCAGMSRLAAAVAATRGVAGRVAPVVAAAAAAIGSFQVGGPPPAAAAATVGVTAAAAAVAIGVPRLIRWRYGDPAQEAVRRSPSAARAAPPVLREVIGQPIDRLAKLTGEPIN